MAGAHRTRNFPPKIARRSGRRLAHVRDRYYDPAFHGINWDDVGNRIVRQVENVKSDAEFYALVNRMTGELHDAHTRFNTPEQWENRPQDLGVIHRFQRHANATAAWSRHRRSCRIKRRARGFSPAWSCSP